jgi:hypothetical protein
MKTPFSSKTLIALAVAVAAAAGYKSLANEQPIPPPAIASDSALPANVPLGSPVGQVFKLAQAGVDISVIQNYISNCPTAFNLDADKIIALTDAGLPGDIVNVIFAHDKALPPAAVSVAPPAPAAAPQPPVAPIASAENAPPPPAPNAPPGDLNLNEVSQTLTPYGAWVNVDGYGRCWRPNVVVYDATWRPYCDRGQWVYTDCGWYWNSDYAWGVTFHYGRWFNSSQYGWCWWPDTVWAPSWVTWRSANDYCGWAPLPPYTVYQPGLGFTYRGGNVSLSFGFGLAANCYTFVSVGNFCQPHPRYYCFPQSQVTQIYSQTTIINNFNCNNHCMVNNGVSVTVIGNAARRPIQPVPIGNVVNGGRRGWSGQSVNSPGRHFGSDASDGSKGRQFTGNAARGDNGSSSVTATGSANRRDQREPAFTARDANKDLRPAQVVAAPENRRDQRGQREPVFTARNANPVPQPAPAPTAQAPVRNPAPVVVSTPNPLPNSRSDNGREARQFVRTYTPPVASTPTPGRVTPQNNWTAANPAPTARAEVRVQPRQAVPQPRYVAPVAPAAPVIAAERSQPRSEPRQNIVQSAPRSVAPSVPAMPAPVQNQARNGNAGTSGNGNVSGRIQGWMAQNR